MGDGCSDFAMYNTIVILQVESIGQEVLVLYNGTLYFLPRFTLWALLFVMARLLTLTLSVLTFGFGLARSENQGFSISEGNFNVLTVRLVYHPSLSNKPHTAFYQVSNTYYFSLTSECGFSGSLHILSV